MIGILSVCWKAKNCILLPMLSEKKKKSGNQMKVKSTELYSIALGWHQYNSGYRFNSLLPFLFSHSYSVIFFFSSFFFSFSICSIISFSLFFNFLTEEKKKEIKDWVTGKKGEIYTLSNGNDFFFWLFIWFFCFLQFFLLLLYFYSKLLSNGCSRKINLWK